MKRRPSLPWTRLFARRLPWFWAVVAVVSSLACGCQLMHREPAATPQRKPWWKEILPPRGEYFFDERSRSIERNLERSNDVSIN